jgi:rhodanese-related sulfurtransferase
MLGILKNMLGSKADMEQLIKSGAQIIDVRTSGEYAGGHVKGSVNIPLNDLPRKLSSIKKDKPVITCCASGMRSASAASFLKSNGFTEVYNGGSWLSVNKYI